MNIQQMTERVFQQANGLIEVAAKNKRPMEYSFVVQEHKAAIELVLSRSVGAAPQFSIVYIETSSVSLFQRATRLTNLDILKALKEIGNAHIRENVSLE